MTDATSSRSSRKRRRRIKQKSNSFLKWLYEMPFWAWFLLLTLVLYWIWNPVEWIPSLWTVIFAGFWYEGPGINYPARAILVAITGIIIFLAYKASKDAIGLGGKLLIVGFVGLFIWLAYDKGWLDLKNTTFWQWVWQPTLGLVFATGICWPKIWYAITGRRGVADPDTVHPEDLEDHPYDDDEHP